MLWCISKKGDRIVFSLLLNANIWSYSCASTGETSACTYWERGHFLLNVSGRRGTSALVAVHALFNVKLIKLEHAMMKEKISMSRNFSQAFIVGFHYLLPFILHRNIVTRFLIKQRYSLMNPNFLQVKLKCPQVNLLSSVLNLKYDTNTYSEGVSYIKQSRWST